MKTLGLLVCLVLLGLGTLLLVILSFLNLSFFWGNCPGTLLERVPHRRIVVGSQDCLVM